MRYLYAQIDENGVAVAVSELSGEVEQANMIRLDAGAGDVLGRRWSGGKWIEVEPEPEVSAAITRLEFRERFTPAEKVAIYTAAKQSVELQVWLDDLAAASDVRTDYPATVGGVQALEAAGLIAPGRAAEILA